MILCQPTHLIDGRARPKKRGTGCKPSSIRSTVDLKIYALHWIEEGSLIPALTTVNVNFSNSYEYREYRGAAEKGRS